MPNRTDAAADVDEAWEALSLHATPNTLIGGDLNVDINGDDGSLAARWLQDVMDDQCMTRVGRGDDGHTYEMRRAINGRASTTGWRGTLWQTACNRAVTSTE